MRVRMLTPEKLGKVFDVPEDKAADLIARGIAEVYQELVMTASSKPVMVRERRG